MPGRTAPATAQTVCQNCLKKGHWTYECKEERAAYQCRPSRTQQLKNKRLRQKCMEDAPPELPPGGFLLDDRMRLGVKKDKGPSKDEMEILKKRLKVARKTIKKDGSSSSSSNSSSDSDSSSSSSDSSPKKKKKRKSHDDAKKN
eukprot:GEMP01082675.1.p1 GENE.GEMP01082675.1~~GEMP01082675.1.p1  ORF type:complete len:144 (+),score=36.55 GEMP01082675.1:181-612(+)